MRRAERWIQPSKNRCFFFLSCFACTWRADCLETVAAVFAWAATLSVCVGMMYICVLHPLCVCWPFYMIDHHRHTAHVQKERVSPCGNHFIIHGCYVYRTHTRSTQCLTKMTWMSVASWWFERRCRCRWHAHDFAFIFLSSQFFKVVVIHGPGQWCKPSRSPRSTTVCNRELWLYIVFFSFFFWYLFGVFVCLCCSWSELWIMEAYHIFSFLYHKIMYTRNVMLAVCVCHSSAVEGNAVVVVCFVCDRPPFCPYLHTRSSVHH